MSGGYEPKPMETRGDYHARMEQMFDSGGADEIDWDEDTYDFVFCLACEQIEHLDHIDVDGMPDTWERCPFCMVIPYRFKMVNMAEANRLAGAR